MSKTKPVRKDNAIDELAFVWQFNAFFSSKEEVDKVLTDLHLELKETLPDSNITRNPMLEQIGVICFKRSEKDPNRHEWALRVEANRIMVTCSEYTNWKAVSTKASEYLRAARTKIKWTDNPITEIVYQCADKFVCPDDNIVFNDVFFRDSEYLTPHISRNTPEAWHVYQGWFEELSSVSARMLHNLNINVYHGPFIDNGTPTQHRSHEATVNHLIRILLGSDKKETGFSTLLDAAHDSNKKVLKKLLCQEMLQTIGLKDD